MAKIILDFDSTIANTHLAVLNLYREVTRDFGTNVNDEEIKWDMTNVCRLWNAQQIDAVFTTSRLFDHMQLFDGVIEVLKKLKADGHTIEICTIHRKNGIPFKKKFIEGVLGDLIDKLYVIEEENVGNIVFDKSKCEGDLAIDDREEALNSMDKVTNKLIFGTYSWNKDSNKYDRITRWDDSTYKKIKSIIDKKVPTKEVKQVNKKKLK